MGQVQHAPIFVHTRPFEPNMNHHTEMTQAANLWLEELSKDSIYDPLDCLRLVWQKLLSQGARDIEATPHCTQPPIS
ncbi:MAG TPA: hypothetical protein PKY96_07625 [Flavobacteriales bacterium]|nr:hypothetical protein [Flavobacteriales bacterium]